MTVGSSTGRQQVAGSFIGWQAVSYLLCLFRGGDLPGADGPDGFVGYYHVGPFGGGEGGGQGRELWVRQWWVGWGVVCIQCMYIYIHLRMKSSGVECAHRILHTPHSILHTLLHTPYSILYSKLQTPLHTPYSTPYSTPHTLLHTPYSTPYSILYFILHTPHSTPYSTLNTLLYPPSPLYG